jgi:hypothetical protein
MPDICCKTAQTMFSFAYSTVDAESRDVLQQADTYTKICVAGQQHERPRHINIPNFQVAFELHKKCL